MISVRKRISILAIVILLVAGFFIWRRLQQKSVDSDSVTLYGNVDIRQVQIAFNDSERIDKLLVDEGSVVHAGQLIGQLVQQRFSDAVAQDRSLIAAQQQVVARMHAGSRPGRDCRGTRRCCRGRSQCCRRAGQRKERRTALSPPANARRAAIRFPADSG